MLRTISLWMAVQRDECAHIQWSTIVSCAMADYSVDVCTLDSCAMGGCALGGCAVDGCTVGGCAADCCAVDGCTVGGCAMDGCTVGGCAVGGYAVDGCTVRGCAVDGCAVGVLWMVVLCLMTDNAVGGCTLCRWLCCGRLYPWPVSW